jgi:hypothetical protein
LQRGDHAADEVGDLPERIHATFAQLVDVAAREIEITHRAQCAGVEYDAVVEDLLNLRVLLRPHAKAFRMIVDAHADHGSRLADLRLLLAKLHVVTVGERGKYARDERPRNFTGDDGPERHVDGHVGRRRAEVFLCVAPLPRREARLQWDELIAAHEETFERERAVRASQAIRYLHRRCAQAGERFPGFLCVSHDDHCGGGVDAGRLFARTIARPVGFLGRQRDARRTHAALRDQAQLDFTVRRVLGVDARAASHLLGAQPDAFGTLLTNRIEQLLYRTCHRGAA